MSNATIQDIQMAYTDEGSGPAVVFVHGYPFNRTLWTEQVSALAATHRVVVPDLRGFGETDVGSSESTMNQLARDVKHLMDHLRIEKAFIGGLSMGGYVTLAFYKEFRERVSGLLLANTRAEQDSEAAKASRQEQAEKALTEGMAGIADSMLPKLLTPETVSKKPDLVKRIRDMMLKTDPKGAAAALLGMAGRDDFTTELSKISVPVLIIAGEEDALIPKQHSQRMHQAITGSRLAVIDHAAHVVNLEQPDAFNHELLQFVTQLNYW
ncbi:MAG TPA: alpha/beta fold hydrolase [Pyrinomonadaceae bacterium]|nr:alpha/beta fold hydrolase [Pyrinomonadaceae bacterium]